MLSPTLDLVAAGTPPAAAVVQAVVVLPLIIVAALPSIRLVSPSLHRLIGVHFKVLLDGLLRIIT